MKKANKETYIDVLNVISCIAMVTLHTNNCFWSFSKEKYWISANIIESLLYFAVPVFFMITGITLIDYRERYSTKEYFKRRIIKVFIPYLFWSCIAIVYRYVTRSSIVKGMSVLDLIVGIFTSEIWTTFWFFIPLFIIYLEIPLVSLVKKDDRKKIYSLLIIALFVIYSLIPFINNFFIFSFATINQSKAQFGYLIYPLLGYWLVNYTLDKKYEYVIYFLGIVGLFAHIIGTYKLSYEANAIVTTYKEYLNVPCVLYSVSVFVLIRNICIKFDFSSVNAVNVLRKYTFSIYLLNEFVIKSINVLIDLDVTSIFYRLLGPCIIIPVCCLIAYIARKMRFGILLP